MTVLRMLMFGAQPAYDLPDLVDNRLFSDHIHLRVENSGTHTLHNVRLHVQPSTWVSASSSPIPTKLVPGQRTTLYTFLSLDEQHNTQALPATMCPLVITLHVSAFSSAGEQAAGRARDRPPCFECPKP